MNTYFNNSYKEVRDEDSTYFIVTDEELINGASISFIIEGYAYILPSEKLFVKTEEMNSNFWLDFIKKTIISSLLVILLWNILPLYMTMKKMKLAFMEEVERN